jgi:Flp pilus assembly pilin Flp
VKIEMQAYIQYWVNKLNREDGQTMAEYGVVLAVITIGIVFALTALSGGISAALDAVTGVLGG